VGVWLAQGQEGAVVRIGSVAGREFSLGAGVRSEYESYRVPFHG
jgi:hypothetical protein